MTAIVSIPSRSGLGASHRPSGRISKEAADVSDGDITCVVERCQKILSYYEEESHKPESETARRLVEQLSKDEQEVAANCSYAYWFLSTLPEEQKNRLHTSVESVRFATAMREADRHTHCSDDPEVVLKLLRETVHFHKTNKTHQYRSCMTDNVCENDSTECLDDVFLSQQRKDRIYDEMSNYQTIVVRGHDKEDRAIFFSFPRKQSGKPDEEGEQAFVDSIVYSLERTIAASEFKSVGRQDQLFVVLDTKNGSCPPFKNLQAAVGVLQKYYPNRLKHCVVLNAPYILAGIWKMLKPFLDPSTASKFVFPSSKASKKSSPISDLIDESQAMPALMPGRGRLDPDVDVDRFLYDVPFYSLYDDVQRPVAKKLPSPTESGSTISMSMTDSSSIDSGRSNTKSRRRRGKSSFFRSFPKSSTKQISRKPKDKLVKVTVRSLATGVLSIEPVSSSEVAVNNMRVVSA